MLKKQNGITLIALIITIIVMLILVGVTINVAINGGLFTKAETTTRETEEKTILEEMLAMMEINNDGKFDYETIIKNMREKHPEYTITYSYPNASITGKLGTYNYIVSETEIEALGEKEELVGKKLNINMDDFSELWSYANSEIINLMGRNLNIKLTYICGNSKILIYMSYHVGFSVDPKIRVSYLPERTEKIVIMH